VASKYILPVPVPAPEVNNAAMHHQHAGEGVEVEMME